MDSVSRSILEPAHFGVSGPSISPNRTGIQTSGSERSTMPANRAEPSGSTLSLKS